MIFVKAFLIWVGWFCFVSGIVNLVSETYLYCTGTFDIKRAIFRCLTISLSFFLWQILSWPRS